MTRADALPGLLVSIRFLRESCPPSPELALAEALAEALAAPDAHAADGCLDRAMDALVVIEHRAGVRRCPVRL